jgi:hypothetical protein
VYQIVAVGGPAGRVKLGAREDRGEAITVATEFTGTVEVVDERLGRLLGTSRDGQWDGALKVERREIL